MQFKDKTSQADSGNTGGVFHREEDEKAPKQELAVPILDSQYVPKPIQLLSAGAASMQH